jgi:hypothetical protein
MGEVAASSAAIGLDQCSRRACDFSVGTAGFETATLDPQTPAWSATQRVPPLPGVFRR